MLRDRKFENADLKTILAGQNLQLVSLRQGVAKAKPASP
jgi:hypothetical protein